MKDAIAMIVGGILALSILCGTLYSCSNKNRELMRACIEKTGDPTRCACALGSMSSGCSETVQLFRPLNESTPEAEALDEKGEGK